MSVIERNNVDAWQRHPRWRRRCDQRPMRFPLCDYCRERGRNREALHVKHREPHGGDAKKFWRGDLRSACDDCFNTKQRD